MEPRRRVPRRRPGCVGASLSHLLPAACIRNLGGVLISLQRAVAGLVAVRLHAPRINMLRNSGRLEFPARYGMTQAEASDADSCEIIMRNMWTAGGKPLPSDLSHFKRARA